ncbi:MAG TPA: trypsin-like peptidase domain-containing protein [Terriglobia bacterium]|nr:trypsin-like peptidase domain-containing protein [Terriglobia bacterium]
MNNKRLLFLGMVALTLGIGVIIGSVVSGGVKATFEQKAAAIAIPDPVSLSNTFSQIAAQLDPAVVKIGVEVQRAPARNRQGGRAQPFPAIPGLPPDLFDFDVPEDRGGRGTGTGFIVDKAGFIMTNHHVVNRASKITVELSDGTSHSATVVGSDEATDLAVLKVTAGRDLPVAKFGNSDAVKVGDWVLAIGSPFGFDHTVTSGIISAKGRDNSLPQFGAETNFRGLQRFLQTDAAINPGNSGGPLVNMAGEVIGVNTAIVSETNSFAGLGFALPSNTALKVYNQLSQNGKVTRGSIGIQYESSRDQTKLDAYGLKGLEAVIVSDVVDGSPAQKAGLQKRDVITEIDGKKISSGSELQDYIVDRPVGSTVKLGFLREGRQQTATVTIGDRNDLFNEAAAAPTVGRDVRPGTPGGAGSSSHLGISVQPLSVPQRRQLNLPEGGVIVTAVSPGSVAADAGLEEDVIITGYVMGGRATPINNVSEFNALDSRLKSGTSLLLTVKVPPQYREEIDVPMKVK